MDESASEVVLHSRESRASDSDLHASRVARPVQRPTTVRYGVLAFAVSMAALLYLDRMAITVAVPSVAHDLGLTISQVGDSVAAFFWCYAVFQVPAGWLGDRWGG